MKIEHVAFNIPEPVQAARWYVEHLGMRVVRSTNEPPHVHFLADSAGHGVLEFYSDPRAAVPNYRAMSPFMLHIALGVDDINETRARLVSAGATADGETMTTPVGDQLAFVRDPWGVTLQLVKRAKPLLG
ncbi:MAG: VOC family protein [Chloroflexi bacterium]|nr:VOC family protein [Chloroflexota bacterium]